MLVLTRKTDQTIRIGENVTITILKVRGNTVRVGINAPREVPVVRGELERELSMDTPQPVTLEFKTTPDEQGTALRIVSDQADAQASSQPTAAIPISIGTNRLQQLVAKVSQFE